MQSAAQKRRKARTQSAERQKVLVATPRKKIAHSATEQPVISMIPETAVLVWWLLLCAIALLNISLWWQCRPSPALVESGDVITLRIEAYVARQWTLSGIYTFVCAFRSFFPKIDLERYVLWDNCLSSIFLGRSAATVAEISFAAQIALFLQFVLEHTNGGMGDVPSTFVRCVIWICVPVLSLAQCFCWYSVLTLNHLGHAIEDSLWAAVPALAGLSSFLMIPFVNSESMQKLLAYGCAGVIVHVMFMTIIDVPMYIRRWNERRRRDDKGGYLSLSKGLPDALSRRVAVKTWAFWREEVPWLTLYFSLGVWLSQGFQTVPSYLSKAENS